MPAQQFGGEFLHPDIPSMAAAYAFHVCQNHPFVDGNKRAAVGAMIAFLSDNGWTLEVIADFAEPAIRRLASGELTKTEFLDWAKDYMREKPHMELREFFGSLNYEMLRAHFTSARLGPTVDAAMDERISTMVEAAESIPAIREAELAAKSADESGQTQYAEVFRQHVQLLTAFYRIAEDMGYEW